MKRLMMNPRKGRSAAVTVPGTPTVLALSAVLALSCLLSASPARADLRVQAHLRLPAVDVVVHAGPGPATCVRSCPAGTDRLSRLDHRIARYLARRTPYKTVVLLGFRRAGYSWLDIGRRLRIAPQVAQATHLVAEKRVKGATRSARAVRPAQAIRPNPASRPVRVKRPVSAIPPAPVARTVPVSRLPR
jgi:hypothetical protein